ncbi:MAG: hypothetical protein ACRD30_07925 [Bryobacteraceae bacterium]
MPFNRDHAIDFADKHWNIPADDGIFFLSNQAVHIAQVRNRNVIPTSGWQKAPVADGWMPFFADDGLGGEKAVFRRLRNGKTEEILINPWAGIADCAHFLSRCLTAGGARIAQTGVPGLVSALQGLPNTKTLGEKVSTDAGQRIVDSGILKKGDMVGYFNVDPKGDYNGARQYAHSAMYAGKVGGDSTGKITCHTICRFPGRSWVEDHWWLKPPGHYIYTFIHFSDDDAAPNPAKAEALAGWWQVDALGRTFYLVHKTGFARATKRAPEKGARNVHGLEDSAYWFMGTADEITLIWKTGTVEVWTPDRGGFKSMMNGVTPGSLKKLF